MCIFHSEPPPKKGGFWGGGVMKFFFRGFKFELRTQVFFQRYFGENWTRSERHAPQNKYVHTQAHIFDFEISKKRLFWAFLGAQKLSREKTWSNLRNIPPKRFTYSLGSKLPVRVVSRPEISMCTHRHTCSMQKFRQKWPFQGVLGVEKTVC